MLNMLNSQVDVMWYKIISVCRFFPLKYAADAACTVLRVAQVIMH